jgi:preprotein translocase subunit YajC
MKKRQRIFLYFVIVIVIINFVLIFNIKKEHGYYIGKIESMESKDNITTVIISPIPSNRRFASEIKANHKIEFADNIMISGLADPNKKRKELYLGQLGEMIDNLKTGDSIIFKVKNYDKNDYKIDIDELAVDLTQD